MRLERRTSAIMIHNEANDGIQHPCFGGIKSHLSNLPGYAPATLCDAAAELPTGKHKRFAPGGNMNGTTSHERPALRKFGSFPREIDC